MEYILNDEHISTFCEALGTTAERIDRIYVNPGRSTNNSNYVFEIAGQSYLYRIPGQGTELFCDREREALAYKMLAPMGITDEVVYIDAKSGIKISKYYKGSRIPLSNSSAELAASMRVLRRLHESDIAFGYTDTLFERMERYYKYALAVGGEPYYLDGFDNYLDQMRLFQANIGSPEDSMCFTHGDASINNILITKEYHEPLLIDMEFPAMGDPYGDIATFCVDAEYRKDDILRMLDYYLGREAAMKEQYRLLGLCAVAGMMWYSWAAYKSAVEEQNQQFLDFRDAYHQYVGDVYAEAMKIAERI